MSKLIILIIFNIFLCSCKSDSGKYFIETISERREYKYTVCLSSSWGDTEYNRQIYNDLLKYIGDYPELEIKYFDVFMNNQAQIEQIKNWVKTGMDLLIVVPGDLNEFESVIEEVRSKDIPVIMLGAKTNNNIYDCYVGVDNYQLGYSAGRYISEHIMTAGGKILEIRGSDGSTIAKGLHEGLSVALNADINSHASNWDAASAKQIAEQIFISEKNFDLVIGHNDEITSAVLETAKNSGLNNIEYVSLGCIGESIIGLEYVNNGEFALTIKIPTGIKEALDSAYGILTGSEGISENIYITPEFIKR